jgi:hypothetical protein
MKQTKVINRIKQIRKGLEAQRKNVVFEEGEPVYIIDKKRLVIGDNKLHGGNDMVSRNHITETNNIPLLSYKFDLFYNQNTECMYIINKTLNKVNLNEIECNIKNLENLISELSAKIK